GARSWRSGTRGETRNQDPLEDAWGCALDPRVGDGVSGEESVVCGAGNRPAYAARRIFRYVLEQVNKQGADSGSEPELGVQGEHVYGVVFRAKESDGACGGRGTAQESRGHEVRQRQLSLNFYLRRGSGGHSSGAFSARGDASAGGSDRIAGVASSW